MPKRQDHHKHWPTGWAHKHGAFYYRPPASIRHLWDDKAWFRLGSTEAEAWATWFSRMRPDNTDIPRTIGEAMDRYSIEILPALAPKTQREYGRALVKLRPVFGHMTLRALKPRHAHQYANQRTKEVRDKQSGETTVVPAKVAAKREIAALSAVLHACTIWGAIDAHPLRGLRLKNPPPRDRYLTDAELLGFIRHCGNQTIAAYAKLKWLTGARQCQLLAATVSDWDGESLLIRPAKRGLPTCHHGDDLREVIAELLTLQKTKRARSMYLISTRNGTRYTGDGFRANWQRAMQRYIAETGNEPFRDGDIRAKAASDSATLLHAQERLGHRSSATTMGHYIRKPRTVATLSIPTASLIRSGGSAPFFL